MGIEVLLGSGIVALFMAICGLFYKLGKGDQRIQSLEQYRESHERETGPIKDQIVTDRTTLVEVVRTQNKMVDKLDGIRDAVNNLTIELRTDYAKRNGSV